MNLRLESAAGYLSGGFELGSAKEKPKQAIPDLKPPDASSSDTRPDSGAQRRRDAENGATQYPKLIGPEAPSSLLFEASLAISSKKRSGGESNGAHIDFPRMINRRWVPSPSQLLMLEELK